MKPLRIREVNSYIKKVLLMDPILRGLSVVGEVSSAKTYPSGHLYLTLKDEEALLAGVIFKWEAAGLDYIPREGDLVEAKGQVTVYEKSGKLQMVIEEIKPQGQGALYEEFLKRKEALEKEGLFDQDKKRAIPPYPQTIGLVTSLQAAALHDFLKVIKRRNPGTGIIIAPSSVQGDKAPAELIEAFRALDRREDIDLIVMTRGGGSLEDLWAFNDPDLVRALAKRTHPLVSAVGHEVDHSLVDLVADLRAPTPSAAAEMVVKDRGDLTQDLDLLYKRASSPLREALMGAGHDLAQAKNDLERALGQEVFVSQEGELDRAMNRLAGAMDKTLSGQAQVLDRLGLSLAYQDLNALIMGARDKLEAEESLMAVTSKRRLEKEEAWLKDQSYRLGQASDSFTRHRVYDQEGKMVYRARDLEIDESLTLAFRDGRVQAQVTDKEESSDI